MHPELTVVQSRAHSQRAHWPPDIELTAQASLGAGRLFVADSALPRVLDTSTNPA